MVNNLVQQTPFRTMKMSKGEQEQSRILIRASWEKLLCIGIACETKCMFVQLQMVHKVEFTNGITPINPSDTSTKSIRKKSSTAI
mmetsp:Transcript_7532/g.9069  ORF Transcript_7532/g.9069 Transcript_7532/m.9069 type:complete len:85 (-) Transcript_7532:2106-2360(-)